MFVLNSDVVDVILNISSWVVPWVINHKKHKIVKKNFFKKNFYYLIFSQLILMMNNKILFKQWQLRYTFFVLTVRGRHSDFSLCSRFLPACDSFALLSLFIFIMFATCLWLTEKSNWFCFPLLKDPLLFIKRPVIFFSVYVFIIELGCFFVFSFGSADMFILKTWSIFFLFLFFFALFSMIFLCIDQKISKSMINVKDAHRYLSLIYLLV